MININIKGIDLQFETAPGLFSPGSVDRGTLAMLSHTEFIKGDKLLDLGCGYGVVGILAARLIGEENVTMSDIDSLAVSASENNARINGVSGVSIVESDGFKNIKDIGYNLILSNPPYHTDFSVAKHFLEKGFNRLAIGGKMIIVTKRKLWHQKKMEAVFGNPRIYETDGYYVMIGIRRSLKYASVKS